MKIHRRENIDCIEYIPNKIIIKLAIQWENKQEIDLAMEWVIFEILLWV